jgi:hypothetical protein
VTKYRTHVLTLLLALVLAIIIHHVKALVFEDDLRRSILSDLFLLDGKPQWRIFQSRLLGPFIARTLMRVSAKPDVGYILFDLIGFGGALLMAWRVGSKVVASWAGALAAMLILTLGVIAVFARSWFYAWDVLGPAFFMIFAWLVVTKAKPAAFVALFAITIWNREDALFIALYLIVQPVVDWWRARSDPARPPIALRPIVIGLACIIGGELLIAALRHFLLIHETGPDLYGPQPDFTMFFQWNLIRNTAYVLLAIPWTALGIPGVMLLPPVAVTVACVYLARVPCGRYLSYALVNLAMVLATLMFGTIRETRIWVDMLPAVVLAVCVALARADAALTQDPSRAFLGDTEQPPGNGQDATS